MSSAAIDIPRARAWSPAHSRAGSPSSASSSTGLYVPVHRRKPSSSSSSSSGSWTPESATFAERTPAPALPIYSREHLLLLANSPLSRLAPQAKADMKDVVPSIVLSRRAAESRKWKARHSSSSSAHPTRPQEHPAFARHDRRRSGGSVFHSDSDSDSTGL